LTRGALLLMESIWVYALVAFLVAALTSHPGKPPFLACLLVVAAPFLMSRAFQRSEVDLGLLRVWGSLLSILLFYALMRGALFGDWRFWDFSWADDLAGHTGDTLEGHYNAFVGASLLRLFWLRGILRGQQYLGFESVLGTFGIGVGVLAFVELLAVKADAP